MSGRKAIAVKVIGIRFCSVSDQAEDLARFLGNGLGLPQMEWTVEPPADGFPGAVFPAGDSWVEVWAAGPEMPAGMMLQIVVDDADAWAERARAGGLDPQGPTDAHGERIYFLTAPDGLAMSFQSKLD